MSRLTTQRMQLPAVDGITEQLPVQSCADDHRVHNRARTDTAPEHFERFSFICQENPRIFPSRTPQWNQGKWALKQFQMPAAAASGESRRSKMMPEMCLPSLVS